MGEISETCREELLQDFPRLSQIGGNPLQEANYQTTAALYDVTHPELAALLPPWQRALGVNIEPGGKLHRHTHNLERDMGKTRYNVVLATNDESTCRNGEDTRHLDDRGVYRMEPYLEHESWNRGDTNRLHLNFITNDV